MFLFIMLTIKLDITRGLEELDKESIISIKRQLNSVSTDAKRRVLCYLKRKAIYVHLKLLRW